MVLYVTCAVIYACPLLAHQWEPCLSCPLAELSKAQGRTSEGTNLVLGSDETIDKWKQLDEKASGA